jgi:hypothetical protein
MEEKKKKKDMRGGRREGSGRPEFQPTDEERQMVERLSGVGLPYHNICALIRNGIDDETLTKHFRKEIDRGKAKANAKVGGALYTKAMGGDTASMIFWAKTQMRWKEVHHIDNTSSDGSMSPVDNNAAILEAIKRKYVDD